MSRGEGRAVRQPNSGYDGGGDDRGRGETLPVALPFLSCGGPAHLSMPL